MIMFAQKMFDKKRQGLESQSHVGMHTIIYFSISHSSRFADT